MAPNPQPGTQRTNIKLPPPQGNVYRVRYFGTAELQRTITTFYYTDTRPRGSATHLFMDELSGALDEIGGLTEKLEACCATDWSSDFKIIDCPDQTTLSPKEYFIGGDGTGVAPHLPMQMAVTIDRKTAFRGQCGRGRISVPAVPYSWTTDSELTTLTAHLALASAMLVNVVAGAQSYEPVLLSYGSKIDPGLGVAGLTECKVKTTLGTCRTRKLGVGI